MEHPKADSFVVYRLPSTTEILIQTGPCVPIQQPLSSEQQGFLISSFAGNEVFLIKGKPENFFLQDFDSTYTFAEHTYTDPGEAHYEQIVQKAIEQIKEDAFLKVVLANTRTFPVQGMQPLDLFLLLEKEYPKAFVYLVSTPHTGTWCGASPEILLSGNFPLYETMALAGTRTQQSTEDWTDKEIHEQKLVEDFLEEKLSERNLSFTKGDRNESSTGMLRHLRTDFQINFSNNDCTPAAFAAFIHPTPAVAGLPVGSAIEFIKQHEGFNRGLYAGYLGPVYGNDLRLFVNLRCMQWHHNSVTLFAGAGITADSIPESEWNETQNKMQTIAKFL